MSDFYVSQILTNVFISNTVTTSPGAFAHFFIEASPRRWARILWTPPVYTFSQYMHCIFKKARLLVLSLQLSCSKIVTWFHSGPFSLGILTTTATNCKFHFKTQSKLICKHSTVCRLQSSPLDGPKILIPWPGMCSCLIKRTSSDIASRTEQAVFGTLTLVCKTGHGAQQLTNLELT